MAKNTEYNFKITTKEQQECLELVESLGIYELRALARVFGDNSPTTLKRNDHINIIMNKIISGEQLRSLPLRAGRPYKELSNIEGILSQISNVVGKEYALKNTPYVTPISKNIVFRQPQEDILCQHIGAIDVRGIILPRNEDEFFLTDVESGKIVLVKKDAHKTLQAYDYVTGSAIVMNEENEYMLENVRSINYQHPDSYHDIEDAYQSNLLPNAKINFDENEIMLGSRYVLKDVTLSQNANQIKQFVKKLKENKVVTIALVANVMMEDILAIKSIGFNNTYFCKYESKPSAAAEMFDALIKHVNRLQQQGYKVAIFAQDVTTFANAVDFVAKNPAKTLMNHTETAVELTKQLVLLAKTGGANKHTTLFTLYDEADLTDPMFVSTILKVSKKITL